MAYKQITVGMFFSNSQDNEVIEAKSISISQNKVQVIVYRRDKFSKAIHDQYSLTKIEMNVERDLFTSVSGFVKKNFWGRKKFVKS